MFSALERRLPIRLQLMLWVLVVVGLILVALGTFRYHHFRTSLSGVIATDVRYKAQEIQDYLRELAAQRGAGGNARPLRLDDPEVLPDSFSDDGMFLQLADPAGRVVQRSANLEDARLPPRRHRAVEVVHLPLAGYARSHRLLLITETAAVSEKQLGWIQVAKSLQGLDDALARAFYTELVGALLGLLLTAAAGYLFSRRALAPVQTMTHTMQEMGERNLERRIDTRCLADDELGELARTFNRLLDRLQAAFVVQQRFVSDASHELKSPLTGIIGHAELLRKRGRDNPRLFEEASGAILREARRLSRLVQDLLLLSRGEAVVDRREPLDLAELVRDVVAQLQPLYPQLQPSVFGSAPLLVLGHTDRLQQVIRNLVDNACRAAGSTGRVEVSVQSDGPRVVLEVCDDGPGIAPDHLPYLFERFYRAELARDRDSGGSGLGLAIVQAIVQAHGGDVTAESVPGGGSRFRVGLPRLTTTAEPVATPGLH